MRNRAWLAALLVFVVSLACASDDPRDRLIETATPRLNQIEAAVVGAEAPIDLSEGFSGSLMPYTIGSPDIAGGTGSPSLSGGIGSPSLTGGVGTTTEPRGGPVSLPTVAGGPDVALVSAVCDMFYGLCVWVDRCDDQDFGEFCLSFPTAECHDFVSRLLIDLGITSVPPQVSSEIGCFADHLPLLGCDQGAFDSLFPVCIPGYVPPSPDTL